MNTESIRFVASRYGRMQGLRLVPLGLLFLAASLWRAASSLEWLPVGMVTNGVAWFWTGLLLAIGLSFVIRDYYLQRFGRAEVSIWRGGGPSLLGLCAGFLGIVWLQEVYISPISLPVVFVGVALGYVGIVHRRRTHYLPVAALTLGFAMLPTLGLSLPLRGVLADALIGVVLVVAGVGDHLVLVRTLRPSLAENDARTI